MIALAMGVDLVDVAREAMLAIGCIQAQKCHTGHCPTGVATRQRRLARGLDTAWFDDERRERLSAALSTPA
jgi:glutamate synthase domain-containing protein 2